MMYTHAARQLRDGRWTSKLGQLEDITHSTTDAIEDSDYGEVVQFMRRPIEKQEIDPVFQFQHLHRAGSPKHYR